MTTKASGMAGQIAGQTRIARVSGSPPEILYRGYRLDELAEKAIYEEIVWLLLEGERANAEQLEALTHDLDAARTLPVELEEVLEKIPADTHPMDILRTGMSFLGHLEPEMDFEHPRDLAIRLIGVLPPLLFHAYHHHRGGPIPCEMQTASQARCFLQRLNGVAPDEVHERALDVALILYAELEFNASTFTARSIAATGSDLHSCLCGAIGSLRGPLHGGANEQAMLMLREFRDPDEAESVIRERLAKKEKIMGFGHRVFRGVDPRSRLIQPWAERLARASGEDTLYQVAQRIEQVVSREKGLYPNVDFYHAVLFEYLGIPPDLATPVFAMARVAGWIAHVFEQRANNRLIRPLAEYIGPTNRIWGDSSSC